jgi:hypothetical protein
MGHVRCCLSDLETWPLVTQTILLQVDRTLCVIPINVDVTEGVAVLSCSVWSRQRGKELMLNSVSK